MERDLVTLHALASGERVEEGRARLAEAVEGTVGAPGEGGMLEVELSAGSREEALAPVPAPYDPPPPQAP